VARYVYQGVFKDLSGNAVSGGRVKPYLADTLTEAKFYQAETGSTSATNYVESDSNGQWSFFIDSADYSVAQEFKVILQKTGYQSTTYDDIAIIPWSSTANRHDLLVNLEGLTFINKPPLYGMVNISLYLK